MALTDAGDDPPARAAQLYFDSGHLALAGWMWSGSSWALGWMGRPAEALAVADRALELERALGQPEGEAMALLMGGRAGGGRGRAGTRELRRLDFLSVSPMELAP